MTRPVRLDMWQNIVNVGWRKGTTTTTQPTTTSEPTSTSEPVTGVWVKFQNIGSSNLDSDCNETFVDWGGDIDWTPWQFITHVGAGAPGTDCWDRAGFTRTVSVYGYPNSGVGTKDGFLFYFHRDTDPTLTMVPEGTTSVLCTDWDCTLHPGVQESLLYTGGPDIPDDTDHGFSK